MRNFFIITALILCAQNFAQELMAEVRVDYTQVQGSSTTAYQALEKSLKDFINTTKWTDKNYKIQERIECNFTIIIREKIGSNQYQANLLVQSRRPVFNTNYYSPVLNINDSDFSFEYTEFEQLIFNPRRFSDKNLTDVIGYYIYLILGYDADTFAREGGTTYFQTAQNIAGNSESSRYSGWSSMSGPRSRSGLVNDILNPKNKVLRQLYYTYHRTGMDMMAKSELNAKNAMGNALLTLENFQKSNNYAQNYPLDIFFQAKKSEIGQVYSGGIKPSIQITKLKDLLNTISPGNKSNWSQIQ
ncbi:MAG: DUF4835 family protein [Flavobacteriaceae bacterium]|nr:DUF4835 family protein [Flavobacteriaceae bacterium]